MFCTKCGAEYVDGTSFCGRCGAPTAGQQTFNAPRALTKRQYLNGACSKAAKTNQKVIKGLGIASIAIQSISCLLSAILLLGLAEAVASHFDTEFDASFLVPWLCIVIVFLGITSLLTISGMKTKRTGLLTTSTFFAFFSALFSSIYKERLLVAMIVVAIHIVMVVLSTLNTKEYKSFLSQNK